MNYQKIYHQLMQKRKLHKPTEYYQKHHIKPRSLYPQLRKDKNNIVCLTYREHYIAHWLLTKIYKNNPKMIFAFWRMNCCQNNLYINSHAYTKIKIQNAQLTSQRMKGKYIGKLNPHYGKHHSQETKKLLSIYRKGTHVSEETKQKIKNTLGKKVLCVETNKIYISTRDAERILNINHVGINYCCNGKRKTAGGYHWKYL